MKYLTLVLLSAFSFCSTAQTQSLDIVGIWETQHEGTYVTITSSITGKPVEGKILFSDKTEAPIGKQVLSNFKREGERWSVNLYSIERDKDYEGYVNRKGNKLIIDVSVLFVTKTIEWTERSKDDVAHARFKASKTFSN